MGLVICDAVVLAAVVVERGVIATRAGAVVTALGEGCDWPPCFCWSMVLVDGVALWMVEVAARVAVSAISLALVAFFVVVVVVFVMTVGPVSAMVSPSDSFVLLAGGKYSMF